MTTDQLLAELEAMLAARRKRKMGDYKVVPVEPTPDMLAAGEYALEAGCYASGIYADMLAPAPAVQGEPVEGLSFVYRHPESGETHSVKLSREEVAEQMEQELFEKLTACFCECEPIGETNVVDCRCDEYADQFELVTAPQPAEQSLTTMVDAAMVEMENISPPLRRSECERLIRAALADHRKGAEE